MKLAKQADGSVLVKYGDSVVLATVCVNKNFDPEKGFLPLTVEYREKSYAIGKIPGNFFRREGRRISGCSFNESLLQTHCD